MIRVPSIEHRHEMDGRHEDRQNMYEMRRDKAKREAEQWRYMQG